MMRSLAALLSCAVLASAAAPPSAIVDDATGAIRIETDRLAVGIRTQGYVSGVAAGEFRDKATGAVDLGFGLHIMDFLLAPGWREDGYEREPRWHGKLAKHFVEGPQICTKAKKLEPRIVRGPDFVGVEFSFQFTQSGAGYKAGSTWKQTLIFPNGLRYMLSSEEIVSANAVDNLFYRIDMPGHIKHKGGDRFEQVYLSYLGKPLPASEFREEFAPDARFLYQRDSSKPIPPSMIRAYQVRRDGSPGPWLAGITLDPSAVSEAWCHQRGYVCMIQELHGQAVKAGERFGAAYAVGWFDSVEEMEKVAQQYRGVSRIVLTDSTYRLEKTGMPR